MKKTTMVFGVLSFVCLIGLIPMGQLVSRTCSCVDMTIVKNTCAFVEEYVSYKVKSGGCNLNSCDITVTVNCKDTSDHDAPYSHDVKLTDPTCKACAGNTEILNPPISDVNKKVGTGYDEFNFME